MRPPGRAAEATVRSDMPLADLKGRTYGPISYRLGREKIADFVEATHESPDRWSESATPAFS